jgi:hypothetical protein
LCKHGLNIDFPFLYFSFSYSNNGPSIEEVGLYELEENIRKEWRQIHLRPQAKHGFTALIFTKELNSLKNPEQSFITFGRKM